MRDVNLETITSSLSWYKMLLPSELSLIRAKRRTSHETERSLSFFLEPSHKPKVVYKDNSMEFGPETVLSVDSYCCAITNRLSSSLRTLLSLFSCFGYACILFIISW